MSLIMYTFHRKSPLHFTSLHFTSHHFTLLHITSLHFTPCFSLTSTFRHYIITLQIPSRNFTSFLFTYNYFPNLLFKNMWSTGESQQRLCRQQVPQFDQLQMYGMDNLKKNINMVNCKIWPLYPQETIPGVRIWIWGWVDHRACPDVWENRASIFATGIRTPDIPTRSLVSIRTALFRSQYEH